MSDQKQSEFERAGKTRQASLIEEFALLVTENRKWWLIPIPAVLGLVGVLVILGSTGAAPFIYTLF